MIITTTNYIENATIEKYLGVVTTNLVIGTGFLSDLVASFTDFFGGMSGTYRRQMDDLYEKAYNALSLKASSMGANGILGFKNDFDEISGKGVQMFMISVSGTAVRLKAEFTTSEEVSDYIPSVSSDVVNIELFKYNWGNRNKELSPSSSEINFILENGLWELVPSLYDYYVTYNQESDARAIDEYFPTLMSVISYEVAMQFIYNDYLDRWRLAYPLIKKNKLFNAQKVLDIMRDGNVDLAITLLQTEKKTYTRTDVEDMECIIKYLDNLPDKGQIAEVRAGAFSAKMVEMYIYPFGHRNDKNIEFCENYGCGLNIKGLTPEQVEVIKVFKEKVRIVKNMFK